MAVRVKFKANRRGIAEIGRSPAMERMLLDKAALVEARFNAIAPVRTGQYINSLRTIVKRGRTVVVILRATAPHSAYLEWGTSKMRRQRVLGRALLAVGGSGGAGLSVLRIR